MCIYSVPNNEIWHRYIYYISCICASRDVELGPIASLLPLFLSPCVTGMCSDLIRTTLGLPLRAGRCEIMHLVCRGQVRRSRYFWCERIERVRQDQRHIERRGIETGPVTGACISTVLVCPHCVCVRVQKDIGVYWYLFSNHLRVCVCVSIRRD